MQVLLAFSMALRLQHQLVELLMLGLSHPLLSLIWRLTAGCQTLEHTIKFFPLALGLFEGQLGASFPFPSYHQASSS